MLWISLHLPQLPLEAIVRGAPTPEPVAIVEAQRILVCDARAWHRGVRPGMKLAAATALVPQLRLLARDPAAETEALLGLASWASQFTPSVALELPSINPTSVPLPSPSQGEGQGEGSEGVPQRRPSSSNRSTPIPTFPLAGGRGNATGDASASLPSPSQGEGQGGGSEGVPHRHSSPSNSRTPIPAFPLEGGRSRGARASALGTRARPLLPPHGAAALLLEVEGSVKLFGSIERIAEQLRAGAEAMGFDAYIASAPTARAATWLARIGETTHLTAIDDLATRLAPLPLAVTGCDMETLASLGAIGASTVGDLLALPREGLARRFGQSLLDRLDQALGRAADPRNFYVPPPTFRARIDFVAEVTQAEALLFAAHRLLVQLEGYLAARASAVPRFSLTIAHRGAGAIASTGDELRTLESHSAAERPKSPRPPSAVRKPEPSRTPPSSARPLAPPDRDPAYLRRRIHAPGRGDLGLDVGGDEREPLVRASPEGRTAVPERGRQDDARAPSSADIAMERGDELAGSLQPVQPGQCLEPVPFTCRERARLGDVRTPGESSTRAFTTIDVGLVAPSRDATHLTAILRERLGRTALAEPARSITLVAETIVPLAAENRSLFRDAAPAAEDWARLVERLRARLGHEAVHGLATAADHRPERAWRRAELVATRASMTRASRAGRKAREGQDAAAGSAAVAGSAHHAGESMTQALRVGRKARKGRDDAAGSNTVADAENGAGATAAAARLGRRPFWLLAAPRRLEQIAEKPHCGGPLALVAGPERIEAGWWDGAPCMRDYFVARTPDDALLWVYREASGWYVHGMFG